ncbi:MAG: L,D-transpeptidase family protein [Sphingomonas sp.]|nr:L,D-transpeptidase family protein [Sphingomonas sp.]
MLVSGLAACQPNAPQQVDHRRSLVEAALPQHAQEGRLILSRAQQAEALAAGTVDRPIKSLLKVDKPLHFGEFTWNDAGIPSGPVWIRIDPRAQLLSVFRNGHEIGTTVIVYGGDNKETPTGTFHILARDKDHRSSLYDAAMPYTLQLTNDGVAIHGSTVRWGAATHGCIGVPLEFARRLFDQAKVGDEVVILPFSPKTAVSRRS